MIRKTLLATTLTALAATGAAAQTTSPLSDGWLARADIMNRHDNPAGALDQSRRTLDSRLLTPTQRSDARFIRAVSALKCGNLELGRRLLELYLEEEPATADRYAAIMALGAVDIASRQYASALGRYAMLPSSPFDSEGNRELDFNRAYCTMMLGDYDTALRLFDTVGESGELGADAHFYRGYIAYVKGDYDRALRLFKSVDRSRMPGAAAPFYEMEIDFSRQNYDSALATARKLLKSPATSAEFIAECNRVAGESLYNLGRESEALPYLWQYAAVASTPAPSAYYILGVSEFNDGNNDAAIKLLQRAVSAENAMAQSAYLFLGQAYLKRGDSDSALMAFERAYEMDYDRNVRETAFYNYAVARMDGGRVPFGSSVRLLEDFLREFPGSRYAPKVRRYVVEGYMSQNDYEAALESLNAATDLSPELRTARQRVLFVMGTREYTAGRYGKALTHLKEAAAMTGSGVDASVTAQSRLWLGDCLYRSGDYDGAAANYKAFLSNIPSDANESYNRAVALYDLGYARFAAAKYTEALTDFDRAEKAGQGGVLDTSVLADINNRAGDCLYYSRRLEEAQGRYARAYDLSPLTGDYATYQMAVVQGLRGEHVAKISRLDRLMADFPETGLVPSALLEKAESQLALGHRVDAIDTYRLLVNKYSATAPGRNGYLQLALTYLSAGDRHKAMETYKEVITLYPSSDEARLAADDLKRMYAADGDLDSYVSFINNIPDAPRIDTGEIEHLTFEAAENAYNRDGSTSRLADYLDQYPQGADAPRALYYLAENAWNSGQSQRAAALASQLVETYPHSEQAEDALLLKGEAEMAQGKNEKALATLRDLEERASGAEMLHNARMGIIRATDALGRSEETLATADMLLSSTAASGGDAQAEIHFMRAKALSRLGRTSEARKTWRALADHPENLYGSMSAVYLGESLLRDGKTDEAKKVIDALIDANPSHSYWLARGFIVYSDILSRQGKTFEAREYLKSLRANYPGRESDIFDMINQRLNK